MSSLSERLAHVEIMASVDPRTVRDLEAIQNQLARLEGKLYGIAKRRSHWTRLGSLAPMLEESQSSPA